MQQPPTPALDLWEERFVTGWRGQQREHPGTWQYDDLWRAAAWEQTALQYHREHSTDRVRSCLKRAERILEEVE